MDFTIVYDPPTEITTITVQGEANIVSIYKMLDQLAPVLVQTKCHRVLVNVLNADHHLTLIEMLTISGMMQNMAAEHGIELKSLRRAMVTTNNGKMMEVYEVIAKYASENFRRFQTLEEVKN